MSVAEEWFEEVKSPLMVKSGFQLYLKNYSKYQKMFYIKALQLPLFIYVNKIFNKPFF